MKRIIILLIALSPLLLQAQLEKKLKKSIELQMPQTVEDSMPGTRGAAVVWHPLQKKYYAAFAGNQDYPFAVFNSTGKLLSDAYQTCMVDIRGIWYNPKLKKICGNGYNNIGWFSYKLDAKGIPVVSEIIAAGMNQPNSQSIGVYNSTTNNVFFLYGQNIYMYTADAMQEEDSIIRLYPGISKKEDIDEDDDGEYLSEEYNNNVLLYTGIPKAEFGILNIEEKQVELYNRKTGLLTQKLKLPSDIETYPSFSFSYSNGIFWAFDQTTRIWTGYK